jgi:hypothetical protein
MHALDELYNRAASAARSEGIPVDDTPHGPLALWVRRNCAYRTDTEFFIVLGIAGAMADLEAQGQGYINAADRAARKAFQH